MVFRRRPTPLLLLLIGLLSTASPALATTIEEANALKDAAEASSENREELAITVAAYERALAAYDELEEWSESLDIVDELVVIHSRACELDPAVDWADRYVERLFTNSDIRLSSTFYNTTVTATSRLTHLLVLTDQPDQVASTFVRSQSFLFELQQSVEVLDGIQSGPQLWNARARLATEQLTLLPEDADASALVRDLQALREVEGTIVQIEGFLDDIENIQESGLRAELRAELLVTVLQLSQRSGYDYGSLRALVGLSHLALQLGDYAQAVDYGQSAQTLTMRMTDSDYAQALVSYLLGQGEQAMGNADSAIAHYTDVLTYLESQERTDLRVWTIDIRQSELVTHLISLYRQVGQPQQAAQIEEDYRTTTFTPRFSLTPSGPRRYSSTFFASIYSFSYELDQCIEDTEDSPRPQLEPSDSPLLRFPSPPPPGQ